MKKSEKKLVPKGTRVMLKNVDTTTGPVEIVRYLSGNRVYVRTVGGGAMLYAVNLNRVIVPGAGGGK